MAELKQVNSVFAFALTIKEVEYIRDITQNALYENETDNQYMIREAIFKMTQKALENNK